MQLNIFQIIFNATCQLMLCDPNWSFSTEYTFTSKTSFSSPLSPFLSLKLAVCASFAQEKKKLNSLFRKLFCYCPCSTCNTAVAQNLRLHFSRKLQKKRYRKFSHLFSHSFLKKLAHVLIRKRVSNFNLPSMHHTCIQQKNFVSSRCFLGNARAKVALHTCSQLFPALIARLKKIFGARAKRFAKSNCSN